MTKQKKLMNKIEKLLINHFKGSKIKLDHSEERIFGTLVWKGFGKFDQLDRQELVWGLLLKALTDDEQAQVAAILTAIPAELSHA